MFNAISTYCKTDKIVQNLRPLHSHRKLLVLIFFIFYFCFQKKIQKEIKNWIKSGNAQSCFEIPPIIFGDGPRAFLLTKINTFTIKVRLLELPGTSISNSHHIESKTAKK